MSHIDATDVKDVRVALEITNISADIEVAPGWQLSDDAETWPTSTTSPGLFTFTARTTEGITYNTDFEDVSAGMTKKFVRFGVWVMNDSGSTHESCLAAIRIEIKKV